MNNSPDLMPFFIYILIALSALYAAWVNLVKKRISKVGFDAFILVFYDVFNKRNATMIRENPQLIHRMGIITLVVGLSSLNATVEFFIESIWPHLR